MNHVNAPPAPLGGEPLDLMFFEIEQALNAGLFYLAVGMSLAVPDICAALESANGDTTGQQYKAWFNANLAARYPFLTAVDCWSLRCGVLHQGRMGHPKSQYARVIFTMDAPRGGVFHNNVVNDALNLDARTFCSDVIAAARQWYANNSQTPSVVNNVERLVKLRPEGLPPYMVGMPVIT